MEFIINKTPRSAYINWCKWFATSNIVIFYLLGLIYFRHLPASLDPYATIFLIFALLGHLGLLSLLTFIPIGLFLFIWPRFSSVVALGVIITTFNICRDCCATEYCNYWY